MVSDSSKSLLVFGMHRSGTSAMAKVCNLMGVHFGHQLIPPDEYNSKGYFEDSRITETHDEILYSLGISWDFPGLLPGDWLEAETTRSMQGQLEGIALSLLQNQSLVGFKDPRLSRLLPLWQPLSHALGCLPYCVIMVRSPLEVAASLARRDRLTFDQSICLWLAYSLEAERLSRSYPRVFIHYENLLSDPKRCLDRLTDCFGDIWVHAYATVANDINEFLDPGLRHYRADNFGSASNPVPRSVSMLYGFLLRESTGETVDPVSYDELYHDWVRQMGDFTNIAISDCAKRLRQSLRRTQQEGMQLQQQFEAKHRELMDISDWASGLKQNLARVQDENRQLQQQFEAKHRELMGTSDRASELKQNLARVQDENRQLQQQVQNWTDRHETKHAELMKMSDWAYGMKLRLEEIDRSYLMRVATRMMALEYRARNQVNRLLAHPVWLRWRQRKNYRQNMAKFPQLQESVASKNGRLVIAFPIITWEFRRQRPQHIITGLSTHGFAVLYLAMTLVGKGRLYQTVAEAGADLGFNQLAEHIHQIWLHSNKQINIYTDPLQDSDLINLQLGLTAAIQAAQAEKLYYLVHFPGWTPLALALREKLGGTLIFDCMDDHSGFSTNTEQALQTEKILIQQADLVIASSYALEKKLKVQNPSTILVKNGTEPDHFRQPRANGELNYLQGQPIIGYYGAISDWFDLDLIIYCARRRPTWHFVLIGSTFGCDTESAQSLPNISFLGEKPYTELPGYLAYFDVCTIPFKILPLTMATNPVKFYEYLSSGKPVVAVDLPELYPYEEVCFIAHNPDEFLQQLENALSHKDDPELVARRISLAKENSWERRVETILQHPMFGMV